MKAGWDFFDAHGNQGHMYSYFLFEAKDLTLIYADRVLSMRNASLSGAEAVITRNTKRARGALAPAFDDETAAMAAALERDVYEAYPCPFPLRVKERAYLHFTGNRKPWSKWNPQDTRFQLWYDAADKVEGIDLQRDVFGERNT